MKTYKYYLSFLFILVLSACNLFNKDFDYIKNNSSAAEIMFIVPDTSKAIPNPNTGQQPTLTQPSYDVTSGVFHINANTIITAQFKNDNIASLKVNSFRISKVGKIVREEKASFTSFTNNQANFSYPLSTLDTTGLALTAKAPKNSISLEFVATTKDNKVLTRFFTVNAIK